MKTRFLHCADIHLGYQQYNDKERFNDFGRALFAIVDKALGKPTAFDPSIQGKVDFVILAGDLFQKRAIDALTLNQAIRALERLRARGHSLSSPSKATTNAPTTKIPSAG